MARASQLAYDYIRQRILSGEYRPGQRLIEAQLAETIGVSRNTINKVLLLLENENLCTIEANKGATVQSYSIEQIQEYYEIRKSLEVIAVKATVHRITDDDINELKSVFNHMCELKDREDFDGYSQSNKQFHNIIYEISGKEKTVEIIKSIKNQLTRYLFRTMITPGRSDNSLLEHKVLLEALEKRDEVAAITAIETHMDNVIKAIVKYRNLFN